MPALHCLAALLPLDARMFRLFGALRRPFDELPRLFRAFRCLFGAFRCLFRLLPRLFRLMPRLFRLLPRLLRLLPRLGEVCLHLLQLIGDRQSLERLRIEIATMDIKAGWQWRRFTRCHRDR